MWLEWLGGMLGLIGVQALNEARPTIGRPAAAAVFSARLASTPERLATLDRAGLYEIADQVESHARRVLPDTDNRDQRTRLLRALRAVALIERRWDDALQLSSELRVLEDKPAARAVEGLVFDAYAAAAAVHGEESGRFVVAFRREFGERLDAIDGAVAGYALRELRADLITQPPNIVRGRLRGPIAAALEAEGRQVGFDTALAILNAHLLLTDWLPLSGDMIAALTQRLRRADMRVPDLWAPRLVELAPGDVAAPVVVAIWDTGLDPQVFGAQLWTNAAEVANGRDDDANGFVDDLHGFAFDAERRPAVGERMTFPESGSGDYSRLLRLAQGYADLDSGAETDAVDFLRATLAVLEPDAFAALNEDLARLNVYVHGTGVGSIAQAGLPGIRLIDGRYFYRVGQAMPPIDEADGEARARYFGQAVRYLREQGARIVNMSFALTEKDVEASLAPIEPDPARRRARANAIFTLMAEAFEAAVRAAPDILFVAGGGNGNEDIDAIRSFPAGLDLPNLIAVGAVDLRLRPTSFTSFGASIHVYANGRSVPQTAPGGLRLTASGTSSAAPFVTNLAAKLLAICPSLDVGGVRRIIEETATREGPAQLRVIHPRAAVDHLRGSSRCLGSGRAPTQGART